MTGFTYYSYDLLSGAPIGQLPLRGVSFGEQLNAAGQLQATVDMTDPRVQAANPIACTTPNRTFLVVDYDGDLLWGGMVTTRNRGRSADTSGTTGSFPIQAQELWSYFNQRVQATDYSAPPSSGITASMSFWPQVPWDPNLIICQIIGDAIGYSDSSTIVNGNPLGGLGLLLNGAAPSAAVSANYVAITFPYASVQTVASIVSQLTGLGYTIGPDIGIDLAYTNGPGSPVVATINVSYPRRGRTVAENQLVCDLQTARAYQFPEDGTQTANQVYEVGGNGALEVNVNPYPLDQGYPLLERVMSKGNLQAQNIISMLGQTGTADLAMYSYAPIAPTVTLGLFDPNLPLGSFIVGDDVQLVMPQYAGDGQLFDPGFPAGLNQEWRIVGYQATVADSGDSTLALTLNQPPAVQPQAAAV